MIPTGVAAVSVSGVSDLAPASSWSDEDTIEQGPGVRIVRGEDEEEQP